MSGVFQFVQGHPYLFANLPILAAVILVPRLATNRDFGRAAVFGGLACLPCSLAEITSGEYWHPVLLGGVRCGVEDLIFTYATGAAQLRLLLDCGRAVGNAGAGHPARRDCLGCHVWRGVAGCDCIGARHQGV